MKKIAQNYPHSFDHSLFAVKQQQNGTKRPPLTNLQLAATFFQKPRGYHLDWNSQILIPTNHLYSLLYSYIHGRSYAI